MPSADTAPSLLSRLSPAAPLPTVSRSSPFRDLPPHAQNGVDNEGQPGASSPATSPFKPSFLSSSPPKASTSPRKGNALRSPLPAAGAHLTPLPDDVLEKAQPIPAARSTRSSRWAASPPTSPPLSSSSPQAVFGSPSSIRSGGTRPIAMALASSPGSAHAAISPPRGSHGSLGSPAMEQIESMLAQLRATPSSSTPPKLSTSHTRTPSFLPRDSSQELTPSLPAVAPATLPLPPSVPASAEPPAEAMSASPPKKVLGGRSKWARADDDEPDEFASIKEKQEQEAAQAAATVTPRADGPAQPVPDTTIRITETATDPTPASVPAVSAPPALPQQQPPMVNPSVATIRAETANAHLSWADDDDDELPDLDDWGIPTSSLPTPTTLDDYDEPTHPPVPAPSAAQAHPTLPPLGARRRSHSNASSSGGNGNKHRSPPHSAARLPPTSPRDASAHVPPPKAPSRLFANAARAATGAAAGVKDLPPHAGGNGQAVTRSQAAPLQKTPQAQQQQQHTPKTRERMAPSGALFSRLSGLAPPGSGAGAAGPGPGRGALPVTSANGHGPPNTSSTGAGTGAGGASGKRRSRGGKPRASGAAAPSVGAGGSGGGMDAAAGVGSGAAGGSGPAPKPARVTHASPPPPPPPPSEGGSWRARGGTTASKWA